MGNTFSKRLVKPHRVHPMITPKRTRCGTTESTNDNIIDLHDIFTQWAQWKLGQRYKTLVDVDTSDLSITKDKETYHEEERKECELAPDGPRTQELKNDTDTSGKYEIYVGELTKSSYKWSQTKGVRLSVDVSVNVGLPTISRLTATTGVQFELSRTETGTKEEEESHGQKIQVDVPPWSKVFLSTHTKKHVQKVPFSLQISLQGSVSIQMKDKSPSGKTKTAKGDVVDIFQTFGEGTSFKIDNGQNGKRKVCLTIEGVFEGVRTIDKVSVNVEKGALEAVSQNTELGRRHDIVLLIRLREVREGETIDEMVWDQCVPETTEGVDVQSVAAILKRNESRVLFLLDGYDELRPRAREAWQAIPKLLSGRVYPNSTIVITSRPSSGVQQHTQPDCHVQIIGFSPEHVKKFVTQYFSTIGKPQLAGKLIRILEERRSVTDLIHTPIFLLLVCVLWEEDQMDMSTGTMTRMYDELLTFLGREYCKREGVDMPSDELPVRVTASLLQLGKLALEALLRNETVLDLSQVERESVDWNLLRKLGVVSLMESSSRLHPKKQLIFSHNTMQEFLAGRYVASRSLRSSDIAHLLQLTSITKAFELGNTLLFTCGRNAKTAKAVWEELGILSRKTFAHLHGNIAERPALHREIRVVLVDLEPETMPDPEVKPAAKITAEYESFFLLCLDILNEMNFRKHPEVLKVVRKALPVLVFDNISYTMPKLASALRNLVGLIELDISVNEIEDKGLEYLVDILPLFKAMKVLDLSRTCISDKGISGLVTALPHLLKLQVLDVSWNSIGDSGTVSLVETLCAQNRSPGIANDEQPSYNTTQPEPHTGYSSGARTRTGQSHGSASLYMEQFDNSVTRDSSRHNARQEPGIWSSGKNNIPRSRTRDLLRNTALQELYIGYSSKRTKAGLGEVARLISTLPTLTRLDMSGHCGIPTHLSDIDAFALAKSIFILRDLEWLELLFICMGREGFHAVVKASERHPKLRELR
ncbi:hypothetical protein Bbelb_089190 [Branchiostoma belcheri]|nr:hypothetical protein Bbelb_089190 [Branchiostoma belcheri]